MLFHPSLQILWQQGSPYRDMGNVPVTLYPDSPCFLGGGCLIYPASFLSSVKMRLDSLFDNSRLRYFVSICFLLLC